MNNLSIIVYTKDGEVSMWIKNPTGLWHKWMRTPQDYCDRMFDLTKHKKFNNMEYSWWGSLDTAPENNGYTLIGEIK